MNGNEPAEVPFVEQLRSVPKDFRVSREIQWATDGTPTGHQFIPVGFMFHRAADELERLQSNRPEVEDSNRLDWLQSHRATVYRSEVAHHWVVVDETKRCREGNVKKTLREAIDSARGINQLEPQR